MSSKWSLAELRAEYEKMEINYDEVFKNVKSLCNDRRGMLTHEEYLNDGKVVSMQWDIPLAELVVNFFDRLKSISSGYASLDYEHKEYREADIKIVVFHLNGDPVDALTFLVNS